MARKANLSINALVSNLISHKMFHLPNIFLSRQAVRKNWVSSAVDGQLDQLQNGLPQKKEYIPPWVTTT
jgi:hypothetical protein